MSPPSRKYVPTYVIPMAAEPRTTLPEGRGWLYELKLDGYRVVLLKDGPRVEIRSRNNKNLNRIYPEVVRAGSRLTPAQLVLDGEVVALDPAGRPSFQALQRRGDELGYPIVYYVFDLLHLNGRDLTGWPLTKRRTQLTKIIVPDQTLRLSEELPGTASEVVEAVRAAGLEGVIAKRSDSTYQAGERSADWVKLKLQLQQVRETCNCRVITLRFSSKSFCRCASDCAAGLRISQTRSKKNLRHSRR